MIKNKVQLITYPDSLGKDLIELNTILKKYFNGCFTGIHLLPPFPSSGDRGFAPIDYFSINPKFGTWEDIKKLGENYQLMLDLMVNHISKESIYFKDFIKNGEDSDYKSYFIKFDNVWQDGKPKQTDIDKIFLRRQKPYSVFNIKGKRIKIWTTFGKEDPSEQIDLNVNQPAVKKYFINLFSHFKEQNISGVRLDAVGYVIKKPGTSCFFVEPEIYKFIDWMNVEAINREMYVLPEVHAHYSYQNKLADREYWIYDFILPFNILEALLSQKSDLLLKYLNNRPQKQITMLDCHDGIPVLPDLIDKIDIKRTKAVIKHCKEKGANISRILSDEHKYKGIDAHQINCTYYDALSRNDDKYILARCLQLFTPGIPQIYYAGLLASKNDYKAVKATGDGRAINRHNYSLHEIKEKIKLPVVKRLTKLIQFRNTHKAFDGEFKIDDFGENRFNLSYVNRDNYAKLIVDLNKIDYKIEYMENNIVKKFRP